MNPQTQAMTVLFDGNCRLCRRTVDFLKNADIFHRIEFINVMGPEAVRVIKENQLDSVAVVTDMHAIEGEKITKGYYAYRAIAWHIPLLWLSVPFLYIWPVTALGRKIYRKVADSRTCEVPKRESN